MEWLLILTFWRTPNLPDTYVEPFQTEQACKAQVGLLFTTGPDRFVNARCVNIEDLLLAKEAE